MKRPAMSLKDMFPRLVGAPSIWMDACPSNTTASQLWMAVTFSRYQLFSLCMKSDLAQAVIQPSSVKRLSGTGAFSNDRTRLSATFLRAIDGKQSQVHHFTVNGDILMVHLQFATDVCHVLTPDLGIASYRLFSGKSASLGTMRWSVMNAFAIVGPLDKALHMLFSISGGATAPVAMLTR